MYGCVHTHFLTNFFGEARAFIHIVGSLRIGILGLAELFFWVQGWRGASINAPFSYHCMLDSSQKRLEDQLATSVGDLVENERGKF